MDSWHSDHQGELRQTTKFDHQPVDNESIRNSSFNEVPQVGSKAMPEENDTPRSNQDSRATNLAHKHVGPIYENSNIGQSLSLIWKNMNPC